MMKKQVLQKKVLLPLVLVCMAATMAIANGIFAESSLRVTESTAIAEAVYQLQDWNPEQMQRPSDSGVHILVREESSYIKQGSIDTHFLFVSVVGCEPPVGNTSVQERIPLNVCLVIDRSGSMSGQSIEKVREAAIFLVRNLHPTDVVSIVIYDHEVTTLVKPVSASQKTQIISAISEITARGSTNLCGGLEEAYKLMGTNYKQGYVNRVLLLSDGLANVGITDPAKINQIALRANINKGISTSTFGVGIQFNEDLMLSIAESGSGNYYYIQNPEDIPAIFEKEWNGLNRIVAQNARFIIELPSYIRVIHMYGSDNISTTSGKLETLWRDIASGEQRQFLVSYIIDSDVAHKQGMQPIQARLVYDDGVSGVKNKQWNHTIKRKVTNDELLLQSAQDTLVMARYARLHTHWLMTQAMEHVDRGDYEGAKVYFKENKQLNQKMKGVAHDSVYQIQHAMMDQYESKSEEIRRAPPAQKNMIQKSAKSENYIMKSAR